MKKTLNIGKGTKANKAGNYPARLWIEGNFLIDSGFNQGDFFTIENNQLIISNDETIKRRKVSGKNGNPIIDLTGKAVINLTGSDSGKVELSGNNGVITVNLIQE